jgi:membrane protein YdbS with pleckstrin-like domain
MSYVRTVLQPGETVRFETNLHWILYAPGLLLAVLAGVAYWLALGPDAWYGLWATIAVLLVAGAVILLFRTWFERWTTEIAVTSRRIIYKRGFVWRQTKEIALDKVESVDADQSIPGRLLDYGTIRVHGTGQAIEELKSISAPIQFRNHVTAEN